MEAFLVIMSGIFIWLIVLSKKRMQEFPLSADSTGRGTPGSYAALELE